MRYRRFLKWLYWTSRFDLTLEWQWARDEVSWWSVAFQHVCTLCRGKITSVNDDTRRRSSSGEQFRTTLYAGFGNKEKCFRAGRSAVIISSPFKLNSHSSLCLMSFCMDSQQIPHHSLNRLELLMKRGKNAAAAGARGLFFRGKEKKVRGYGLEIGTSLFHRCCQDRTNELARCFQLEEHPEQH